MKIYPTILFEGVDGSGKTTALNSLKDHYEKEGIKVFVVPSISMDNFKKSFDSKFFDINNPNVKYLNYIAYQVNNWFRNVEKQKQEGIVLIDRYLPSCFAYNYKYDLDDNVESLLISTLNNYIDNFYRPDITFIFDAPYDVLAERLEKRGEKVPNIDFVNGVREGYKMFVKNFDWHVRAVNGNNDIKKILELLLFELDLGVQ